MGQTFDYLKHMVVNFKVDMCCWLAPVKIGLLIIAYLNIIVQAISLIGLSDDTFVSLTMYVQTAILDDNAKKSLPVLGHAIDLSFTVILLCAVYRKDIQLMRLYQRYCIAAVIMSVLVYSMIVAALGVLLGIVLVMDIVFQLYVLVLVRSAIVEIKQEKKDQELQSTYVMSTLTLKSKEDKIEPDVEAPPDADETEVKLENGEKKDRLETVDERPETSHSEEPKTQQEVKENK
ncbi:unnamed protein product [Arctia plantaginis]|uniref:Uncharacterized protein n=1 Tax=Arctia plantaginis TaxID=874455 RepID=A0A8S0Z5V9_ARCPL|nr:unnamed protein product [Arctia plantaginis]CAB3228336.1 unnamed protein product [Arctia plantaginis]